MKAAEQWAKEVTAAWRDAVRDDPTMILGFEARTAALIHQIQRDALGQAARACRQIANQSTAHDRPAADRCVDALVNLSLDARPPVTG